VSHTVLAVAPRPSAARRRRPRWRGAGAAAAAPPVALATVIAGIGWLYLLSRAHGLTVGPRLPDALPLQRLAGGAGQPVLRVAAAWLAAGLVAGVLLRAAGVRSRGARGVTVLLLVGALLVALGMAADAVTASEPLGRHLAPQLHRTATALAAVLAALAAALPGGRS